MINPTLDTIDSYINGNLYAKDAERAFTYFEFVKEWGFGLDPDDFITQYKDYLVRWNRVKNGDFQMTTEEFVQQKMIDILKSITLDYSSYEEQDFISHLDWNNRAHLRAVLPLYCRKIREVTEFYRQKRNEAHLTVQRNSFKGSTKSIEEIIYTKVFDYIFHNKNVQVQYADLKRDLLISIENYVDTYSEYFDIPRYESPTEASRTAMLEANINDVSWKDYLQIKTVISETLYSGNVYLQEIPLIAQLGLDLTQQCVGDMLQLRNTLVQNTTINLVPLTEQVSLRRRLYEKFLGCDLYYMYTDVNSEIVKSDILCYAKNPTGNLLNCGNPDQAVIQSEQLELLSNIGLFFKPDKTSILKVNAKNYTWEIDKENLEPDMVYIFPDPDIYGDIGNNKTKEYPFIMRYKLDYDIKNMSSGDACDDPLLLITDQGWRGYFSKQDEDFRYIDNKNYEYSFTALANRGIIQQYQVDAWGNQFGLVKGMQTRYLDINGNEVLSEDDAERVIIEIPDGFVDEPSSEPIEDQSTPQPILLNGGYFEDPYHPGKPFDFERKIRINSTYNWSGMELAEKPIIIPSLLYKTISLGHFGSHMDIKFEDHFNRINPDIIDIRDQDSYIDTSIKDFFSKRIDNDPDYKYKIKTVKYTRQELQEAPGELWVRVSNSLTTKPMMLKDMLPNGIHDNIISFQIINETMVVEYNDRWLVIPYTFDGDSLSVAGSTENIVKEKYTAAYYVESERSFYIINLGQIDKHDTSQLTISAYKYNCNNRRLYRLLDKVEHEDFIIPFSNLGLLKRINFSYNGSLNVFLISYLCFDDCETPYLYEHKFKLSDEVIFEKTISTNIYSISTPDQTERLYGESIDSLNFFD